MDPFGVGRGANGAHAQLPPPPPPSDDPYPSAKRAAEDLLSAASDLQADAFAGRGPAAVSAWRAALSDLDAHVSALEAAARAMVGDPPRFGLDPASARRREGEVAGLRYAADDLLRAADSLSASSSSARGGGGGAGAAGEVWGDVELGGVAGAGAGAGAAAAARQGGRPMVSFAPPPGLARREDGGGGGWKGGGGAGIGGGRHGGADVESGRAGAAAGGAGGAATLGGDGDGGLGGLALGAQQHQQQIVARQDAALDEISQRAESVRRIGLAMHEELESQARALDELGEEVDATQLQVRSLRRRAADVLRRAGGDRQICTIAFLVVVLVVLTVMAIA